MMPQFGHVCFNVENMDEAIAFYENVLGLELKRHDGDRWAEFDVGGVKLALTNAKDDSGRPFNGHVAFRVTDVREWARENTQHLADVDVESGPHEDTVSISGPGGHTIIVYSPRSSSRGKRARPA